MKLDRGTITRLALGAIAALIGFALVQTDVSIPDQIKAVLVAVLGYLGYAKAE